MKGENEVPTKKVLVIEDDPDLARLLDLHLRDMGCEVRIARDGPSGLQTAQEMPPDLIILDLMLPGMDGLEVCRRLRAAPPYTPILMLTAKSSELDRVLGLEIGADDYLTKPFSLREVVARVKAVFRRMDALRTEKAGTATPLIRAGELQINPETRTVTLNQKPLDLTAKEFDLLLHFARTPGRVYTRTQLLDQVWGYAFEGYEHTVNSHINRLRAKVERDPSRPRFILTVWGVGYKFTETPNSPEEPDAA